MSKLQDNINKEMLKLAEHLKGKSNEKLIEGYKNANKDYKNTRNIRIKCARDMIGKVLEQRGIDLEKLKE